MNKDEGTSEVKTANVQTCLLKLKNLLKVLPEKESDAINWKELLENKEAAQKALNHLLLLFSGEPTDVKLVGCKWLDPTY